MSNLLELFEIEYNNSNELVKICIDCKITKSIDHFNKNRNKCKQCSSVDWKNYYYKNKQKLHQKGKEYRNKKRTPEQNKKFLKEKEYKEELFKLQEQGKRRCRICHEIKELDLFPSDISDKVFFNKKSYCKKCAHEKWRIPRSKTEKFKLKKSIEDKKYRNKPEVLQKIKDKQKKRYHTEINFKLKMSIRNRINKVLKAKGQKKIGSFVDNLGCSIDQLIEHLEKQFYTNPETGERMTWENHSQKGWHIDHIKPLSSFNLENDEEFKEACSYKNLQPLWWKENLSKGNKS